MSDSIAFTYKTVAEVLVGKHLPKRKPHCYTLEAYEETPFLIPMDMTEDVVELVAQKLMGVTGSSYTYLEALQGWLIKFGYHSKKLRIIV